MYEEGVVAVPRINVVPLRLMKLTDQDVSRCLSLWS
jgi:hypothetical protein